MKGFLLPGVLAGGVVSGGVQQKVPTNSEVMKTKLLQKREMRKDIVIELSYKGFSRASDYS